MKMNKLFFLMCAAVLIASCAPQVDRSVVPTPSAAPEIQLGSYESFSLDNGLKVIVVSNDKLPRVSFQLSVDRGPLLEGEKAGAAELAGGLLAAGTATRTKAEIDETVDFMGASLSTYSSGASASGLSKHAEDVFALMADVVLNPQFPEDELAKAKKRTLSGLASNKTDPNTMSANITSSRNFGADHPYGEIVTEKSVEAVNRADLQNYYGTYFKPNISYLVMVGDISVEKATEFANTYFGDWAIGDVTKGTWSTPKAPLRAEVAFVPLDGAVQSVIDITFPVDLKPGDEDAIAVRMMNNILGGGTFSGRLFQNLREDKAYTYGAYSSFDTDPVIGSFSASSSVRNEVTDSAITQIMFEIRRMIKEPVPDSTIQFMKNWMTGTFALGLESPQTIARYALNIERYGLPKDYYQGYLTRLSAITSADIQRVASRYLKPNNANITVVGSRHEVGATLDQFGEVTYYDMYGGIWTDMEAAPDGVTADSVLENYLQAIGGREALAEVNSYTVTGVMETSGMEMAFTSHMKNNEKIALKVEMMGMVAMEQKFNGSKGTIAQMGQSQAMDEAAMTESRYQSDMMFEAHLADFGIQANLLGIEEIDEQRAYAVELTFPSGKTRIDHFSVETGLRVQQSETTEVPGAGMMTSLTKYVAYTEVDGVKFPKQMVQQAGPQVIQVNYSEIKVNSNPKDSEFE